MTADRVGHRVFVDTNVLYPASLADLVLSSAEYGVFELCWSADLLAEIERVLVTDRGLAPSKATTFVRQIAATFPDGEIRRAAYEEIIETLSGPDPDDLVHLAAAIAGKADVVVTFNVGDFASAMAPAEMHVPMVMHPDDYFSALVDEGLRVDLLDITIGMALRRKSPPMTWQQLIDRLASVGVPQTIGKLTA